MRKMIRYKKKEEEKESVGGGNREAKNEENIGSREVEKMKKKERLKGKRINIEHSVRIKLTKVRKVSISISCGRLSYLPTPPLGQDMTQGQILSGV